MFNIHNSGMYSLMHIHVWQYNCVTSSAMLLKKTTLYLNGVVLNCLDKTQDMKMQSKTKKGKCLYWLMMTRHKYTSTTPHLASQMIIHLFFFLIDKNICYQKISQMVLSLQTQDMINTNSETILSCNGCMFHYACCKKYIYLNIRDRVSVKRAVTHVFFKISIFFLIL